MISAATITVFKPAFPDDDEKVRPKLHCVIHVTCKACSFTFNVHCVTCCPRDCGSCKADLTGLDDRISVALAVLRLGGTPKAAEEALLRSSGSGARNAPDIAVRAWARDNEGDGE